jgi:hypothetical protein
MLFGAYPNMAVTPFAQLAKLLNFRVIVLNIVFLREAGGVVDSNIAAETVEDSCSFEGEKSGV